MYIPKIIPRNRTGLFYKHKENNYMQGGLGGGGGATTSQCLLGQILFKNRTIC